MENVFPVYKWNKLNINKISVEIWVQYKLPFFPSSTFIQIGKSNVM